MSIIIAEIGVNHNGCEDTAFKLIDIAHKAGANIVKFQTFNSKKLASNHAKKADYQIANTNKSESQLEMLSKLELSKKSFKKLSLYCNKIGIEFLSTAFDTESLNFLVNDLKIKRLKIPSGEITNLPFVLDHASRKLPIILSTGMASLAEIEQALSVIAFGYVKSKNIEPSEDEFRNAYNSEVGQNALKENVTLLHCTSEYPAPLESLNLSVIPVLQNTFGLKTGYSDHSSGINIPIIAFVLGASVIEKHFTIDKKMIGPDHQASIEPDELSLMINNINEAKISLGSAVKKPTLNEIKNRTSVRKSIIAAKEIKAGELFTKDNLIIKRPGSGISPSKFWNLIGKTSKNNYLEGDLIIE